MCFKKKVTVFLIAAFLVSVIFGGCVFGRNLGTGNKNRTESGFKKDYVPSEFVQADVESDTLQWFCSAYAIYTSHNRKDLGMIGGTAPENKEMHERAIKNALESGWGIKGHRSAVVKINKLLSGGHRKKYRELIADMKDERLLGIPQEEMEIAVYEDGENEELREYICAYHAYHEFGENAIDGWDYCRALQVLGDCYQADYISLEECLDVSLIVAKRLQSTFANWEDVCRSYLYGYYFWGHSSADTEWRWDIYKELAAMEDGPYTVPYDTELKENWKGVKGKSRDSSGTDLSEEDTTSEGTAVFTPKTDKKGRYILSTTDGKKKVSIGLPDDYECNEEWSSEDNLIFDYKLKEGSEKSYYESLSFRVEESEGSVAEEESFVSILKKEEAYWKKDSLYEDVQYTDTKEMKAGDHTVKYCSVSALTSAAEKICDKMWYVWFETSDGYTVYCSVLESTKDIKDRAVSKKKVKTFMSKIDDQ